MPSRPRSSLELLGSEFSRDEMLMNSLVVATLAVLLNTRTEPVFCTTYQRELLPGSCNIAMGCVKLGRLANARCTASGTVVLGGSPARQVVLAGRPSRPPAGGVPLVVAVAALEAADTLGGMAASTATTVYEY